jgi:hypothetical protein
VIPTVVHQFTPQPPTPAQEQGYGEAQLIVERAVADLQGRLDIGAENISVDLVLPTDFSDASLGMPEPGKTYAQVLTPGYVIHLAAGDQRYIYHGSGEQVVLAAGEAKQVIAVPGDQPAPPAPGQAEFSRVDIADTGLSIEAPNGWFRLEPEWVWTPGEESDLRLGVNWIELEPPVEPEVALLPAPSQTLYSENVTLSWGQGRRFLLEVYAPDAQGGDTKAPVTSVEMHVLAIVDQEGTRRAFDMYVSGPSMEEMGALDPLLQRVLDTSMLAGVLSPVGTAPQQGALPPVVSEGQNPETGWRTLSDGTYGFQLEIPQDWTWKELPAMMPGMPDDWPVTRIVHLFPQAWEADLNRSGPPDPTAKSVVAPLNLEVCVGPDAQFRRAYPEPTRSDQTEINGLQVTVEVEVFDPMWLTRYVFRDPQNPEVSVVLIDYLSGFPDRVEGNERLVELLPAIVETFEFAR